MKKHFLLFIILALTLASCAPKTDSVIGHWTVDKVNVQFDENRSTPELVKQVGEMEKQNSFSIGSDSLLVFKGLDESWQGKASLSESGTLYCDATLFGQWKDGHIVTRTDSPLGEIVITYRKK